MSVYVRAHISTAFSHLNTLNVKHDKLCLEMNIPSYGRLLDRNTIYNIGSEELPDFMHFCAYLLASLSDF